MAILNYTTEVASEKSIGEITSLLVRKGARSIHSRYREDGGIEAISFVMLVAGLPQEFTVPNRTDGVMAVMLKDKPYNSYRQCSKEQYLVKIRSQADRVAWRILKDWVEAQMALVESGQAEAAQVFMPYATQADGRTMWQLYLENTQQRALGAGNGQV